MGRKISVTRSQHKSIYNMARTKFNLASVGVFHGHQRYSLTCHTHNKLYRLYIYIYVYMCMCMYMYMYLYLYIYWAQKQTKHISIKTLYWCYISISITNTALCVIRSANRHELFGFCNTNCITEPKNCILTSHVIMQIYQHDAIIDIQYCLYPWAGICFNSTMDLLSFLGHYTLKHNTHFGTFLFRGPVLFRIRGGMNSW